MDKIVRVAVIGIGNMGRQHVRQLADGKVSGAVLSAVCDVNLDRLKWAGENLRDVAVFETSAALFASDKADAVIIATPHYDHASLAVQAFDAGVHVLCEKPAGVYTLQVKQMNDAAEKSGLVFGMMFNQRQRPIHQKLKDLVASGELGNLMRTNWIISNWYRTQHYYDAGDWRASWRGEGGGVLLNQCPHNLDMWQWICGMPKRVRSFCAFGKYHTIEVEDDVTAYVEYENGATGLFVTSTGEAPGTNRLEIVGDQGKLVMEDDAVTFWRTRKSVSEITRESKEFFAEPEVWKCQIPFNGKGEEHLGVMKNWVNAILKKENLLAPGAEGIRSLELSNAILLSAWQDSWVDLPVDEDLFYSELQKRIKTSRYKKTKTRDSQIVDMSGSFN